VISKENTGRGGKRKCPPDDQPFEEGGEKSWIREDVALRGHGKLERPNVTRAKL